MIWFLVNHTKGHICKISNIGYASERVSQMHHHHLGCDPVTHRVKKNKKNIKKQNYIQLKGLVLHHTLHPPDQN